MTATYAISQSSTLTEARLRQVMLEVGADFYALVAPNLISFEQATKWTEELTHILQNQTANGFQIQLKCAGRLPIALDYRVSDDGSILEAGTAGGINYFALPPGTTASLFVDFNDAAPKAAAVRAYLAQRGWGTNGHVVEGAAARDRAYSNNGYGVVRSKVGTWP